MATLIYACVCACVVQWQADTRVDGKMWLHDDNVYVRVGEFGTARDSWYCRSAFRHLAPPSSNPSTTLHEFSRYNDALLVTWRRGALWAGVGSDASTRLRDGGQYQLAVIHLLSSKKRLPLGALQSTPHFRRVAGHATEVCRERSVG